MENTIKNILIDLDASQSYKGFDYLALGVCLCLNNEQYLKNLMGLYKEIAKRNNTSYICVERCIRFSVQNCNYAKLGFSKTPSNTKIINAIIKIYKQTKPQTFYEILAFAHKHDINIVKLTIAYELECCLSQHIKQEDFEHICTQAYDIYLSLNTYDINAVIRHILDTIFDEEEREELINEYDNDLEEYVRAKIAEDLY